MLQVDIEKRGSWACSKPALLQSLCVAVSVTVSHIPEVTKKRGTASIDILQHNTSPSTPNAKSSDKRAIMAVRDF